MSEKKTTPLAGGASESPVAGAIHRNHASTTPPSQLAPAAFRRSRQALRAIEQLRPWDSNLTRVEPAPDYFPGAVRTRNCPFCARVHFYIGWTGEGDAGIRDLPCHPADMRPEWRVPPIPRKTVLARGGGQ